MINKFLSKGRTRIPFSALREAEKRFLTSSKKDGNDDSEKKKVVVFDPSRFNQISDKVDVKFPYVYSDPDEDHYRRRFYPSLKESPIEDSSDGTLAGWRRKGTEENFGRSFRENRMTRDEFVKRQISLIWMNEQLCLRSDTESRP